MPAYVRSSSGTTKLVCSHITVAGRGPAQPKMASSSIRRPLPLEFSGARITAVSDGISTVWNLGADSVELHPGPGKVDSSKVDSALTLVGICDRTPQVRDAIVTAVADNDSNVSNCSQVTETHLAAVTGTLRGRAA